MIYHSLNTIAELLNTSLYEKWGATINGTNEVVQLNNIANIGDEKNDLQNKIVLTLLKMEEEKSLKNGTFYKKTSGDTFNKHHPAVYLNLYLLLAITKKNYREALQLLSDCITFFQHNKVFTGQVSEGVEGDGEFRLTVELHDINFQEVFEMWSNLGSKQFPFVIYKVRLLRFLETKAIEEVVPIKTVNVHLDPERSLME
jgi:hypothetical protein